MTLEEIFIIFIPSFLFSQGAKPSLIALASSKLLLKAKRVQECGSDVEAPNVGVFWRGALPPYLYMLMVGLGGNRKPC